MLTAAARAPHAALAARDDWGWSLERLAELARHQGRTPEALELSAQRLQLAEDLVAEEPDGLRQYGLGNALAVRALCLLAAATPAAEVTTTVRDLRERACAAARKALTSQPDRRAFLQFACVAHLQLASMQLAEDQPEAAAITTARVRQYVESLLGKDPGNVVIQRLAVDVYILAAGCDERRHEPTSADTNWQLALEHASAAEALTHGTVEHEASSIYVAKQALAAAQARTDPTAIATWSTRYGQLLEARVNRSGAGTDLAALAIWLAADAPAEQRDLPRARDLAQRAANTLGAKAAPAAREQTARALRLCGMEREAAALEAR